MHHPHREAISEEIGSVMNVEALVAELRRHIHLGTTHDGTEAYLPLEELKKTSTHIVGAAGYGKSYFLRNLIRHFVSYGQPFGLIDPHRELFDYAVSAIRRSAVPRDKVTILDPGDQQFSVAFNPLQCGVEDPGEASSLVLEAVLKAWGASSFDQTPRMEGLLRGTFRLLVDNQLTILEAPDVLDIDNGPLRRALRERVSDLWVRQDWEEFEKWPRAEKIALVESSKNRLRRFLQSDAIRRMLGQRHCPIDMRQVMDTGGILLANVGNTQTPEVKRLLGALVVNAVFHSAKQRNPKRRRDFFLIIDECGQFATQDLANSLDELRKFGVHLILAHQRLRQLEHDDADILSAVMTNAKIKLAFGGLERPEADRMARELFTGQVHGDGIKHIAVQTKFRPIQSTFEVETESWSDSEGQTESSSESDSTSDAGSESDSAAYAVNDDNRHLGYRDDDIVNRTSSRGASHTASHSSSASRGTSRSATSGGSRSVVPITVHEEFREETGRQFYSLDEEWEKRISELHQLGKREAFLKVHNGAAVRIRTADVSDEHDERTAARFKEQLLAHSPHVQSSADVTQEIEDRRQSLRALVEQTEEAVRPLNVKSFRES